MTSKFENRFFGGYRALKQGRRNRKRKAKGGSTKGLDEKQQQKNSETEVFLDVRKGVSAMVSVKLKD